MTELITEHTGAKKTVNITVHKHHIVSGDQQYATVNRNTASLENLIAAVHKNNPLIPETIIRLMATEFKIVMVQKLNSGEGFNCFDLGILYLTSKGSIESENPSAEDVPAFGVAFTPSKTARYSVSGIEIDSLTKADTLPAIGSFKDLSTNKSGLEITEGGGMQICGQRLKIAGDTEQTGIFFAPVQEDGSIDADETKWHRVSKVFRNFPKDLSFFLPDELTAGSKWFVVLRSCSTWGTRTSNSLKTAVSENPITIISALNDSN